MSDVATIARERIAELEVDLARWRRVLKASLGAQMPSESQREPSRLDGGKLQPTIADVISLVAERYGVTPGDLRGSSASDPERTARHIAMRLAREVTGASFPAIGRAFNRHHSTIMHGCRAAEGMALGDLREELAGVAA